MKRLFIYFPMRIVLILSMLILTCNLDAVRRRPGFEEDNSIVLREILDSLENLRNDVQIHESRLETYEEKFKNIEDIIDSVRQQMRDNVQGVKETLKTHTSDLNSILTAQKDSSQYIVNEVNTINTDNLKNVNLCKRRLDDLEKNLEIQNANISNLQSALASIVEIIKNKDTAYEKSDKVSSSTTEKIYIVKSGDSLEKIAKQNKTTVKKLKELNNLSNDQIIVNQKLKVVD